MTCLFGFMDYLIVAKWTTNWEGKQAPAIIASMIADVLGKPSAPVIENQTTIFHGLLKAAFVCVPLMLLVIPIYKNSQNKRKIQI